MKLSNDQNYYDLLELPYNATAAEIQTHYRLAKKTYAEDSLGGYSLFNEDERKTLLAKIEAAYNILSHPEKRAAYDQTVGIALSPSGDGKPSETMHTEVIPSPDVPQEVTLGNRLKKVREKQGMTLEDIADMTRINIHYLLSLEANRFQSLPAEVYVYSYLRQVMKILKYQDKTLIEDYMQEYRKGRAASRR